MEDITDGDALARETDGGCVVLDGEHPFSLAIEAAIAAVRVHVLEVHGPEAVLPALMCLAVELHAGMRSDGAEVGDLHDMVDYYWKDETDE